MSTVEELKATVLDKYNISKQTEEYATLTEPRGDVIAYEDLVFWVVCHWMGGALSTAPASFRCLSIQIGSSVKKGSLFDKLLDKHCATLLANGLTDYSSVALKATLVENATKVWGNRRWMWWVGAAAPTVINGPESASMAGGITLEGDAIGDSSSAINRFLLSRSCGVVCGILRLYVLALQEAGVVVHVHGSPIKHMISGTCILEHVAFGVENCFLSYTRGTAPPVTLMMQPAHSLSHEVLVLITEDERQYISDPTVGQMTGDTKPTLSLTSLPGIEELQLDYSPVMGFEWGSYNLVLFNNYNRAECLNNIGKKAGAYGKHARSSASQIGVSEVASAAVNAVTEILLEQAAAA